jgi:hypothetical protein
MAAPFLTASSSYAPHARLLKHSVQWHICSLPTAVIVPLKAEN